MPTALRLVSPPAALPPGPQAHVREKEIPIVCGSSTAPQSVQWLANVAVARFDDEFSEGWRELGHATEVKKGSEDGEALAMEDKVESVLADGDHIFVYTKL